jgi:hypothetical protein
MKEALHSSDTSVLTTATRWIGLAQDRGKWRALAYAVMKLWVPYYAERFLSGWWLLE